MSATLAADGIAGVRTLLHGGRVFDGAGAAELCGLGEVAGLVAPGLAADLVVLHGDPYDLTDLAPRVSQVWQAGRLVDRARLLAR